MKRVVSLPDAAWLGGNIGLTLILSSLQTPLHGIMIAQTLEGERIGSVPFVSFLDGHQPNEHIVLPHQSRLGTFEGLDDQPTGVWPITLLCLQHGRVFERSADTVQFGPVPRMGRRTESTALWEIVCECAQGNCGRKKRIFAFGDEPQTCDRMRTRLLQANPAFQCQGHQFVLDAALMTVERVKENDW